ncbi:hypothetical protein Acsp04_52770 [Actinomadura sp. NBRC 104425]|uniref:hypothetical protein n=1 Tax=Actinomadura sp. NBRC 104425 TaxID=3032204 RepID=UPI0024A265A3|nr:hypothetical protein [Actinomadura sp. NBRC 104425]GLZ15042.1 hypothetical protein Acsp04_52770 [Actinomadura sp. NBRC 104425]
MERAALAASDPEKLPEPSDERFDWERARLAELDTGERAKIVTEAWRMVVPKRVAAAHLGE